MRRFLPLLLAATAAAAAADPTPHPLPAGAVARLGDPLLRHGGYVRGVALSRDGRLLATSSTDDTVRVFAAADGRALWRTRNDRATRSVAFLPDGRLAVLDRNAL